MAFDPLQSTYRASGETTKEAQACQRGILWVSPEQEFTQFGLGSQRIGRGEHCEVRLLGAEVSREHATLSTRGPLSYLADLDSTNGTFHNECRIDSTPVTLADQDVVRLGEWVGVVCTIPRGVKPHVDCSGEMVTGPQSQELLNQARRVAASDLSVILLGESGTGKELISRFIHRNSGRGGRLIAVNCAALPETLAEAELFGHKKGAFTGAERAADGYVRSANDGTLLLDEIGDLPLTIQAKLLRVLEESQVVPLGTPEPINVNVRFLAAGQQSLAAAVVEERFRGDLYARLNGFELRLPPLRERREEILPVFARLARQELTESPMPTLSPKLVERLCLLPWPFNLRQLVQTARQMAVLHPAADEWTVEHLPTSLSEVARRGEAGTAGRVPMPAKEVSALSLGERRELAREREVHDLQGALDRCHGNVSEAARLVGVSRRKAYRLLKRTET